MLGRGHGARRFNDEVVLTYALPEKGTMGHAVISKPRDVMAVPADVQRMSATKTMMTFQQADVVGMEIEFRNPGDDVLFNGIRWRQHEINFSEPERVDNRGRFIRIQGWYQVDNPEII